MLNKPQKLLLPALISAAITAPLPQLAVAATDNTSSQTTSQRINFAIPAGSLDTVLNQFSAQSGFDIAYSSTLTAGKTSNGLKGQYGVTNALQKLLQNSGLVFKVKANGTVTISSQANISTSSLDKIIIRGEKMQRGLAGTASSVVVVESLEDKAHLRSVNDALSNTANMLSSEGSNFAPTVRGIDGTGPGQGGMAFFAGSRTRLGMLVDGRPAEFNELVFGDNSSWDVEQVEIFRGPQSTLNGRNSIAGAVVISTKNPTFEEEGAIRVTAGNHDYRQVAAMYSGPINEDFAFRIAAERQMRDSFIDYEPFAAEPDSGEYHSTSVRAKLLFEPQDNPDFSNLITLTHNDYLGVQGEYYRRPFEQKISDTPTAAMFNPESTSLGMETNWKLNDSFTFENTFIYSDIDVTRTVVPIGGGNATIDTKTILWEPRLRYTGSDNFTGFIGFHAYDAEQDEYIDIFNSSYEDSTRNIALFGEGTYSLTEKTDLTFGGRWEREKRERNGGSVLAVELDETYSSFSPKVSVNHQLNAEWSVGGLISKGYNAGGAGVTFAPPFQDYAYDEESAINYEAFARGDLFDGQLQVSANLFYTKFKDMQLPFSLAATSVIIRNAEEAETYGLELGTRWQATPQLQLLADIGFTKTNINKFGEALPLEGNELQRAPQFTGNFAFQYDSGNNWDLSGNAFYTDSYYSDINNTPRGKIDGHWVANLQGGYTYQDYRIFGFVKNITDQDDITLIPFLGATADGDSANVQHPRTFGLGVEMNF